METMTTTSTPPPSSNRIHTPPAPLLGGYNDSWEPYSPRRSTRISQRTSDRTPSPNSSSRYDAELSLGGSLHSKKSRLVAQGSPGKSPQKKRLPKMDSVRRASTNLTTEGTAQAAAALGLPKPETKKLHPSSAAASSSIGMLPTPAKTPQKPPTEQEKVNVKAIARNIFSTDSKSISANKSRAPQYVLDSFAAQETDQSFEIFTDSNERVPQHDTSLENPFFGPGAATAPPALRKAKGKGKSQMVNIPGEGRMEVEQAVGREDGMVISFRGKKQYMLFSDKDEIAADDEAATSTPISSSRRLRSSIKPRLLFPRKPEQCELHEDDEEAATDIEDHVLAGAGDDEPEAPHTPSDLVEETVGTPKTPRFAPASPPTTTRVTRNGNKSSAETTPMKGKAKQSTSPFRSWAVSKGATQGVKRPGQPNQDGPVKRAKA